MVFQNNGDGDENKPFYDESSEESDAELNSKNKHDQNRKHNESITTRTTYSLDPDHRCVITIYLLILPMEQGK